VVRLDGVLQELDPARPTWRPTSIPGAGRFVTTPPHLMNSIPRIAILLLAFASACSRDRREAAPASSAPIEHRTSPANEQSMARAGTVIDSALPMQELIGRFRTGLPAVDGLVGGERSREALVRRFLVALATRDTVTLTVIVVTRQEYAYIYFPGSHLAKPPYELDPGYAWFHTRSESESGIRRTMRRFGGHSLAYAGHQCTADLTRQGPVKLWTNCVVRLRVDGGPFVEAGLFDAIIEHQGDFKFFSYASGP
jgi:hypothetical protein